MIRAPALLEVRDLRVAFPTPDGVACAVDGVSWAVAPGKVLGIVGESGSGKSVSALTVMGLVRSPQARVEGQVLWQGRDLLTARERDLRGLRGGDLAMVFQDPAAGLHPHLRVRTQVAEAVRAHRDVGRREARERAVELLGLVALPDPTRLARAFPHELSGGTRQRVLLAMALANQPRLLILDEPTSALDVTVQAQVLRLVASLRDRLGMAVVVISHDLGVVAGMADEIAVMYAGQVVERAPAEALFSAPQHPYTWGLLGSLPRLDGPRDRPLVPIPGRPPSLLARPEGCLFHPRCPHVLQRHRVFRPQLGPAGDDSRHQVACLLPADVRERLWAQRATEEARA